MFSGTLGAVKPRVKWKVGETCVFLVVHLAACVAFFPWFFSWTGVVLLVAGCYLFGAVGINLCYHRLITHRSFACPLWLEHAFAVIAVCSLQDSPTHWAAVHRRHHHFSDDEQDPHSPLVSFFWAHMGWLLVRREDMKRRPLMERYAKDVLRDPFYAWLERHNNWIKVALLSWLAFFALGFVIAVLRGEDLASAVQFGLSWLVWGAILRTVVVWHLTWSVNSVTHIWGYRNYETPDRSRNNVIVALLVSGEGWHNNHHADPNSARQGHKWWELDLVWLMIRALMLLGLAKKVALPSPQLAATLSAPAHSPPPR
jgi:stearoyl-CoA desaturase (delta-9 desaturase)